MEENKYRYNDISERLRRMNRIYMGATIFMAALILLYLWMKQMNHNIKTVTVYGNTVLLLAFTVVNAVIYCRNKATSKLKVAVTMEMGIEYLLIGMQTDAHFITYILIASLALQIPYYDKKGLRRTSIGLGILYILVTVVQSVKGINVIDVDTICGIWGVLGILFIIAKIGDITIMFNDDALGSIAEEHEKEKRVLEGVLGISQSIQTESVKSGELIEKLVGVTESVTNSMQEISASANTTAGSIEEQSTMTNSIQDAIGVTGESSKQMVDIAMNSNESIQENIRVMEELRTQSELITNTNHEVTTAMTKLQNKTKEVEEIAGMILNISSQTNLLALNASIEAARAGENGRGFAVVAEQIRALADQSRESTEHINNIVNGLIENSDISVETVKKVTDAFEKQDAKIKDTEAIFGTLNSEINRVGDAIGGITGEVGDLEGHKNNIALGVDNLTEFAQQNAQSGKITRDNMKDLESVMDNCKSSTDRIVGVSNELVKEIKSISKTGLKK